MVGDLHSLNDTPQIAQQLGVVKANGHCLRVNGESVGGYGSTAPQVSSDAEA